MEKKKVVHVLYTLHCGGAETMAVTLAIATNEEQYQPQLVICSGEAEDNALYQILQDKNIPITWLGFDICGKNALIRKAKNFFRFFSAMNNLRPDLLHCHTESRYSFIYALIYHVPVVWTIHSWPDRLYSRVELGLVRKMIQNKLLRIVGCAKCVMERFDMLFKGSDKVSSYIYNPVKIERFLREDTKNRKKPSRIVYISVARLEPIKNHTVLLSAFAILLQQKTNANLMIVGDGSMRKELEQFCEVLGISHAVSFLGYRTDIPTLLTQADVFVSSSNSECCPISVVEAQAAGLPSVATDVGGTAEIVAGAGICVPSGDTVALAEAMERIISDPVRYREYQLLALKNAERFRCDRIAQQYADVYFQVL